MDRSKLILLSVSGIFLSLCSYSFVYASAEHCDIAVLEMRNNISGDPMTQVEQLTRIARSWLQEGNTECAVNEVEESAKTARSVKDQVDRAAAGFEIKDVVFQTIQSDTLLPPVLEKRF